MNTGVYEIKNKINGKRYIGSTFSDLDKRKYEHFWSLKKGCASEILQRAYDKYGEENLIFNVLHRVPKEYCRKLEQFYLNNCKCEYNISKTAEGYFLKTKQKEQLIKNLIIYSKYKGENPSEINNRLSIKVEVIHSVLRGFTYKYIDYPNGLIEKCLEVKKRLKHRPWLGKKRSAATKSKLSESLKGRKNVSTRKKVYCVSDDLQFDCIADCSSYYNIADSNITLCCNKEISNCKGLIFEWVNKPLKIVYRKTERRVICLEDGNIFRTAKHASVYYKIKASLIREGCRYNRKTKTKNGKITFRYYEEKDEKSMQ